MTHGCPTDGDTKIAAVISTRMQPAAWAPDWRDTTVWPGPRSSLLSQQRAVVFRACSREPHGEPEERQSPFPHQAGHHRVVRCVRERGRTHAAVEHPASQFTI